MIYYFHNKFGDKNAKTLSVSYNSYKQNLAVIEKALKAGGNKDFTIAELPKLNHLFQTSETGAPSEYGKIEETISPTVLDLIANWIIKHTSN